MCSWLTLMIHANITGVEADVVLVFISFVLRHTEQHSILHLQPELAMFVFQCSFFLLLGERRKVSSAIHKTRN